MRIALFAKHRVGLESVRALARRGDKVALVVAMRSQADTDWYRELESLCGGEGIEFLPVRRIRDADSVTHLERVRPDVVFSVFFTQIVPASVLSIPPRGIVNFHPSLLPGYRGPHPVNWAIIRGETETGLTAHYMTQEVDGGDIIAQWRVPIAFEDDLATVAARIHRLVPEAVLEVAERFRSGRVEAVPQDQAQASYFPRRTEEDDVIDWAATSVQVHNLVRGLVHPLPGAISFQAGRRVVFRRARPASGPFDPAAEPGAILGIDEAGMRVRTGDGAVRVDRIDIGDRARLTPREAVGAGLLAPDVPFSGDQT